MKKTLFLLAAFCSLALPLQAQKILTVDLNEVYTNYHRAQDAQGKLKSWVENQQDSLRKMIDEGRAKSKEFQELQGKANNPSFTEDARRDFAEKAMALGEEIGKLENQVNNFRQRVDQDLAARHQQILGLHLEEIRKVISKIAKDRGADLVLNASGPNVLFHQDTMDITKEVTAALNADAPAAQK